MEGLASRRIVLLGKTGVGKSCLANTIFGEAKFQTSNYNDLKTHCSQTGTKVVDGRSITLIDTPGFFDIGRCEEELNNEILRCITECAPGPHAFLIVLKVEKFTEQEQAVIDKICQCFSEGALKYAVLVFTHGDQLPEGMNIQEFVSQNENLSALVKRCGGRCNVVDSKYWKDNHQDEQRSNQIQVAELLKTIDEMVEANQESCYTNEMLQNVKREIQKEEEHIRQSSANMSQEEINDKAKMSVLDTLSIRLAGIATGALLGALLGVAETLRTVLELSIVSALTSTGGRDTLVSAAQSGILKGGKIGNDAAKEAETRVEAMKKAAGAVWNQSV